MRYFRLMLIVLISLALAGCAGAAATPTPAAAPTPPTPPTAAATQPVAGNASAPTPATAQITATLAMPTALPAGCRSVAHDVAVATICGTPARVVALGPHMLDMVTALGVQPAGFGGMTDLNLETFTQPGIQIPYQGQYITGTLADVGQRDKVDYAALTALKPDLIVSENYSDLVPEYQKLTSIAPTLLFSGDGNQEWQDTLVYLADALGRSDQVPGVIQAYERKLAATQRALAEVLAEKPTIAVLYSDAPLIKESVYFMPKNDFVGGMLTDLGFEVVRPVVSGDDVGGDWEDNYPEYSYVTDLDPDIVLVLAYSADADAKLKDRSVEYDLNNPYYDVASVEAAWQTVPELVAMRANKEGKVYFLDYYPWENIRGPQAAAYVLDELVRLFGRP